MKCDTVFADDEVVGYVGIRECQHPLLRSSPDVLAWNLRAQPPGYHLRDKPLAAVFQHIGEGDPSAFAVSMFTALVSFAGGVVARLFWSSHGWRATMVASRAGVRAPSL